MASSDHINPGGEGKISAKVDIRGRTGTISKSVQVFSNDPKRPTVTLSIKALMKKQ